ncbi:hypothetical protein VST7929_03120 [Vibrio stylophorae]|uniref:HdeD family acid-resistance protein n=1 Tax=Vibrio stylophorae TaxID=659351 RepID=A0ABN8DVX0_9VIBR|nr:HdeD family acid-resistance protein [Vibrio stylophorae]CAH0535570.1 hypothetical protein VST7929_03120 [Vibrio stylophorae]
MSTPEITGKTLFSKGWKWFVGVGVLTFILGLGAVYLPILAGVTITTLVGGIFLFSGLVQAYHSFKISGWKPKLWYALSALLYIIGGAFILFEPLKGLVTLTTLMVLVMIFNGVTRIIFGLSNRSTNGSQWLALSGLISVGIGVYFFTQLGVPEFSLSLLGIFVGVSMVIEGISFIFLGLQMKKAAN